MSHGISGDRFFTFRYKAWHGIKEPGFLPTDPMNAWLPMRFDVNEVPLYVQNEDGSFREIAFKAIVRGPLKEDPKELVLTVTDSGTKHVSGDRWAQILTDTIDAPVETMGVLHGGRCIFSSWELPSIDVRGELVQNYLLSQLWLDFSRPHSFLLSPVLPVCQNTICLAEGAATEKWTFKPDDLFIKRVVDNFTGVHARFSDKVKIIQETFDILAGHKITQDEQDHILKTLYKEPKKPVLEGIKAKDGVSVEEIQRQRIRGYELAVQHMEESREAVTYLFEGGAKGHDLPVRQGTSWGFYQAITEKEDWMMSSSGSKRNDYAVIFGDKAATKEKALKECLAISR